MNKKNNCPDRPEILAWLDKERQDETIASHVGNCCSCREVVKKIKEENRLIKSTLESLPPMQDLNEKIMARVFALVSPDGNSLFSAFSYLLILSSSFGMLLLYLYIAGFLASSSWSVLLIKGISFVTSIIVNGGTILDYALDWILSGKTLIPSLAITVAVMFINILQKRRLSND